MLLNNFLTSKSNLGLFCELAEAAHDSKLQDHDALYISSTTCNYALSSMKVECKNMSNQLLIQENNGLQSTVNMR